VRNQNKRPRWIVGLLVTAGLLAASVAAPTAPVAEAAAGTSGSTWIERPMWDWNLYEDKNRDKNYWGVQGTSAKVGYDPNGSGQWRSVARFGLDAAMGSTVVSVKLRVKIQSYYPGCDNTAMNVHVTTVLPQNATWNNSGIAPGSWQQSAYGCTSAGQEHLYFESNDALRSTVQAAASGSGQVTFSITSATTGAYKLLVPGETRLLIEYNHAPNAPTDLNLAPAKPCGFGPDRAFITTNQPQFSTRLSDPNSGDSLGARLEIRRKSDGAVVYQDPPGNPTPTVPATGGNLTFAPVPDGKLAAGVTYTYHAVAWDGRAWGPWTNGCEFEVDLGPAGTPLVSSPCEAPACDPEFGMPMGTPRAVTVTPAPGDTDVVRYIYGTGTSAGALGGTVAAGPDGTATIPVTQWTSDPTWLFVKSVDQAGNISVGTASFDIIAAYNTNQPSHVDGDANGDGKADVSADFSASGTQTSVNTWITTPSGSYAPVGTEVNNGYPTGDVRTVRGDFDGDGLTDAATLRQEPNGRITVWTYRFDGAKYVGSPTAALDSAANPGWYLSGLKAVAADFDGDGTSDLGWFFNYGTCQTKLWIFYGSAGKFTGSFGTPAWDSGVNQFCWDRIKIVAGDFDNNGREDVGAFYNWANGCDWSVDHFRQAGARGTATKTATGVMDAGCSDWNRLKPLAGDFDGDGKDDLGHLYNYDNGQTKLWTLTSNGNMSGATFGAETQRWDSGTGMWNWNTLEVSTANLDNAGPDEVAVVERVSSTLTNLWSLHRGADGTSYSRNLRWDGRVLTGTGVAGSGASLTGDRRAELVRIESDGKLWGSPNVDGMHGAWGTARVSATMATEPIRGQFADLDGDGKKEYVFVKTDGVLRGYPNIDGVNDVYGTGRKVGEGFTDPARLRFADLNGDRKDDLIRLDADGTVQAWPNVDGLNNSWGTQRKIADGFTEPDRIRFADLNGDGKDEFIVIEAAGTIRAWPNTDGINYVWGTSRVMGSGFPEPARGHFGDIDGDGKAEIIRVQANGDLLTWWNVDAINGTWGTARVISTGWSDPARLRVA